jgi:hypothetical protein
MSSIVMNTGDVSWFSLHELVKIVSVVLWASRSDEDSACNSDNISGFWRSFTDWKWIVVDNLNLIWSILSILISHPIWWSTWFSCWLVWILSEALIVMVLVSFHDNVLSEIFISVHSSGELTH